MNIIIDNPFPELSEEVLLELEANGYTISTNSDNQKVISNDTLEVIYDDINLLIHVNKYDDTNLQFYSSIQQWARIENDFTHLTQQVEKRYKILRNGICVQEVEAMQIDNFEPNFCNSNTQEQEVAKSRDKEQELLDFSQNKGQLTIFPNPADKTLKVTFSPEFQDAPSRLFIINTIGEVVKERQHDQLGIEENLDIQHLPAGTYFVKAVIEEQILVSKFIKQ